MGEGETVMEEQRERLEAMCVPGQQTWDLSPNDVAAIQAVLAERARLKSLLESATPENAEAHAYLTGRGEIAYCMTHPTDEPLTELGKAAKKTVVELRTANAELNRVAPFLASHGVAGYRFS